MAAASRTFRVNFDVEIYPVAYPPSDQQVVELLQQQGYKVLRLTAQIEGLHQLKRFLHDKGTQWNNFCAEATSYGIPDLFAYKSDLDCFFVEVKCPHDAVRLSQLHWIQRWPDIPTKIVYLASDLELFKLGSVA